jgi:hypothetical protein
MLRTLLRMALCLAVLFVSACASHTEIPFDRASADIKRIGIVQPAFPTNSTVILATTVGQHFGLIGALVDVGMAANREEHVDTLLMEQKLVPKAEFSNALKAALQSRGYEPVDVAPFRKGAEFVAPGAYVGQPPVDAYLDIVASNYGFLAAGIADEAPYRPIIYLKCRLVSAKDPARVLMFDTILVNPLNTPKDAVAVSAPEGYAFVDFDTLMSNPARAAESLAKAIDQSAETVGTVLN